MSVDPSLAAVGLAAARAWACLRVQASWRAAIGPSWEWIAAGLAVAIAILALATSRVAGPMPSTLASLGVALGFELGLGTVLGLVASLPGWALVGASRESEAGLGVSADEGGALTRVIVAGSLAAGIGLGLHAPLLAALLAVFDGFALAQPHQWLAAASPTAAVEGLAAMTTLALALATPVLLTRVLVAVCLVSLGREARGAEGLLAVVGPGVRLAAALVALGAAWSAFPEAFARGM